MSKEKSIFFFNNDLYFGGIETYAYRIAKWAKKNNIDFFFVLPKKGFFDLEFKKLLEKEDISYYFFEKKVISSIFNQYSQVICISPNTINYLRSVCCARKARCNVFCYLYIMHPDFIHFFKQGFMEKLYKKNLLKIIKPDIIFMDRQTKNFAIKEFPDFDFNENKILQLGFDVVLENNNFSLNNNILTISRLDFPFKGYVLGLLSDFLKIAQIYKDIRLTIIGSGKDSAIVAEMLESFPKEIKERIMIVKNVPYDQLNNYFKENGIFIGMGTTLLDATLAGSLAIGAVANQNENSSFGLFCDDPNTIGAFKNIDSYNEKTFFEIITNILALNEKDRKCLIRKGQNAIAENYSLDYVMNYILSNEGKSYRKLRKNINILLIYYYLRNCKYIDNLINFIKN